MASSVATPLETQFGRIPGLLQMTSARASIGRYLDFYNDRRPHSSLDGITPDQAYFNPPPLRLAA